MTQIEFNPGDAKAGAQTGSSVAERMRLAKSWDETLRGMRVIERQEGANRLPQENHRGFARAPSIALSNSATEKLPLSTTDHRDLVNLASRLKAMSAGLHPSCGETKSATGGSAMPRVSCEKSDEIDAATPLQAAARNRSESSRMRDDSEPVIKLRRNEDGVTVLIVHPSLVTPSDVSRFVAELRQSAQSMPIRVRSIRVNGQEVYSEMRHNDTVANAGPKPSHIVDVKF